MIEWMFAILNKIEQDKVRHFASCSILAMVMNVALPPSTPLRWQALALTALALWKEYVWDFSHPDTHTVDWRDALASVLGGLPVWLSALKHGGSL